MTLRINNRERTHCSRHFDRTEMSTFMVAVIYLHLYENKNIQWIKRHLKVGKFLSVINQIRL